MEENNKAKKFMLFGLIVLVITIAVSSTYAYYVWTTSDSDTTKIVAGVGSATVTFDGGSDIENANLRPVSDKSKGIIKTINVKGDTTGLVFNMYLDLITLPDALKEESFRYALYNGETLKKEGNFSSDYLTSNTSTCTENSTSHITLLTNEAISTTNTKYTLYIWIDGANYTNPNTMMNQTFSFKLHANGEGAVLGETLVQKINKLYDNASKTTVTNNSITYNAAPSVSLMNDRLGGTTTGLDGGNIRYYGASPNNYIDIGDVYGEDVVVGNWEAFELGDLFTESSECYAFFDCSSNYADIGFEDEASCIADLPTILEQEFGVSSVDDVCGTTTIIPKGTPTLYRIIGLFKDVELADGTKQDLIKVVRAESIDDYSWDTSDSTINGGYGINEWSQADLMKLLNPGYESETVGGSLWWNSSNGTCYSGRSNSTTTCDFTVKGLSSNAQNKIASVVWNTGGWNSSSVYSNQIYSYERGTTVYSGRPTAWTGKIALPYPSDYGYATDFNNCNSNLNNYSADGCYNNDWLLYSSSFQWLLTPGLIPGSARADRAWYVGYDGNVSNLGVVYNVNAVRPVFYLNSELGIVSGNGSESNPYVVR